MSDAWEQARQHVAAEYPREGCGLVVVRKGKLRFIACTNGATTSSEHFVISAEQYAQAEDEGEIIAVVHSHPDASAYPSDADRVCCEQSGLEWVIYATGADGVCDEYRMTPSGYEAPLVGREFHYGVLDCYTLIRDWYKRELGVRLPHIKSRDKWWERGENLYIENFERHGFVEANDEPRRGDLFLMQIRAPVANHAGVYLGDGQMLHHMYNRLSTREVFGGYWLERTVKHIRFKGLT